MKNTHGAIGALDNMNALLDEDHRVSISTDDYNEKVHSETFYQCAFCTETVTDIINKGEENEETKTIQRPTEISYGDIHLFNRTNNYMETIVLDKPTSRVWTCPKCGVINKLCSTSIIKMERDDPFYLRVVPSQPVRNAGNRVGFDLAFKKYFNMYSRELENAMMNYRKDYIGEHGEDMSDNVFKDRGD